MGETLMVDRDWILERANEIAAEKEIEDPTDEQWLAFYKQAEIDYVDYLANRIDAAREYAKYN